MPRADYFVQSIAEVRQIQKDLTLTTAIIEAVLADAKDVDEITVKNCKTASRQAEALLKYARNLADAWREL